MAEPVKEGEALEVVHTTPMNTVRLATTVEEFKRSLVEYQEFKHAVKTKEDVQIIQGNEFLKKSYWRKVNNAFNLSVRILEEHEVQLSNGDTAWDFTCEAKASNGRTAPGTGSCSLYEKVQFVDGKWVKPREEWKKDEKTKKSYKSTARDKDGNILYDPGFPNTRHNARSTAETRAYNRCVSNLIGGGEVSAEEAEADEGYYNKEETPSESFKTPQKKQEAKKEPPKEQVEEAEKKEPINSTPCNELQVKNIAELVKNSQDPKKADNWICTSYKVDNYGELSYEKADKIIGLLEAANKNKGAKPSPEKEPMITEKQIAFVNTLSKHYHDKGEKLTALCVEMGVGNVNALTIAKAKKIIDKIQSDIEKDHANKKKEETK